uniref:Bm14166 n=1 Tax=Brugia malayi TaxID=6279 RepID=A0A1I9G574_BRUMA|nr:Bm14166 [Brugia malayi]
MACTNSASVNFSELKDFMLFYPPSKPEEVKRLIIKHRDEGHKLQITGSAASLVSQTIVCTLEVQNCSQFYRELFSILSAYAVIDLAIYETLKSYYVNNYNAHPVRDIVALPVCGACSSICGMLASCPFALVRTQLQAVAISDNLTHQIL